MAIADQPQPLEQQDAQKSSKQLFRYSAWLHLGLGAEACEQAETGRCEDAEHFHAWCRLPNQMQHEDIRERALAAKARKIRLLRDRASDAYEVLEGEIADLRRGDRESLVDEVLQKDWWKRQIDALKEVNEQEEFKTAERDRERLRELRAMENPPADELAEIERHLGRYTDAIQARRNELEQPLRDSLQGLTDDELIEQVREDRISTEASNAFMEAYSRWEWLSGTYTNSGLARTPYFDDMAALRSAAPEILEALSTTFTDLEAAMQRGPAGN